MATVDGVIVKVGDYVGFKSDIEQSGKIIKITGNQLLLYNEYGFSGDYIGGEQYTIEAADRCWID